MINSVLNQSFQDFELLLIDDGSTDNSSYICDEFAEKDVRIKVFHKSNGGVSSARNYGLDIAKSEYVIFLDADDLINTNMFQVLINDIQRFNSDIAMCGWRQYDENIKLDLTVNCKEMSRIIKNPINEIFSNKYMSQLINKLIKRTVIGKLRFDEKINYSEDYLFVALLLLNCRSLVIREDVMYYYLKHNNSLSWRDGNLQFWDGYVRSKKIILDKFLEYNLPENICIEARKGYYIAIMSLYRFAVHSRNKALYEEISEKYKIILMEFIKKQKIPFVKKIEYFTFIASYNLAILLHKHNIKNS